MNHQEALDWNIQAAREAQSPEVAGYYYAKAGKHAEALKTGCSADCTYDHTKPFTKFLGKVLWKLRIKNRSDIRSLLRFHTGRDGCSCESCLCDDPERQRFLRRWSEKPYVAWLKDAANHAKELKLAVNGETIAGERSPGQLERLLGAEQLWKDFLGEYTGEDIAKHLYVDIQEGHVKA